MHRRHRLAGRNTLTVTELMRNPLLLLGHDFQTRVLFDEACQAAQFEPSVRLESRSPQSLVALAGAGHGIAIVPSAVTIDVSRVAVAGMLNGPRPLGSWSHVVWDSRRYLPTHAQGLIGCSRITPKPHIPGTGWAISPAPCHDLQCSECSPLAFQAEVIGVILF